MLQMRDSSLGVPSMNHAIIDAIDQNDLVKLKELANKDNSFLELASSDYLHYACSEGKLAIVNWILNQGVSIDQKGGTCDISPLEEAVSQRQTVVVETLLSRGARFDVSSALRNQLFNAISEGFTDVAKILIEKGIDLTRSGNTLQN